MTGEEAAEILNGMRYRPRSEVLAWRSGPHSVDLELRFEAFDSTPLADGRRNDIDVYTITTPPITINVRSLDRLGVQAAGLTALIEVEIHEAREFWRETGSRALAPFHPHRADGEAAWQETRAIPVIVRYPKPR